MYSLYVFKHSEHSGGRVYAQNVNGEFIEALNVFQATFCFSFEFTIEVM